MHADSRIEGGTLVVRIPMRLGRQRGRKRILAPDGSELTPPTKPQPDGVLVKALARAWRWQKLLDRGVYSSVTEIAEAEKISKSYVSRILRLALLAPDIVEAILGGWADQRVMLERAGAAAAGGVGGVSAGCLVDQGVQGKPAFADLFSSDLRRHGVALERCPLEGDALEMQAALAGVAVGAANLLARAAAR